MLKVAAGGGGASGTADVYGSVQAEGAAEALRRRQAGIPQPPSPYGKLDVSKTVGRPKPAVAPSFWERVFGAAPKVKGMMPKMPPGIRFR